MSISARPLTLRKALISAGTLAVGALLVVGAGVAPASAAGAVTQIVILANDASSYSPHSTHSFTIIGEDADGAFVSNETGNTTLTSNFDTDEIVGTAVTFVEPGTHLIKAIWNTDATVKDEIAVSVFPGTAVGIKISPASASVKIHTTTVFSAQSVDSNDNNRGAVNASYKSSSSHDTIHGNSITFGSYGTRTITARNGNFTTTATISVKHVFKPVLSFSGTFATTHTVTASIKGITGTKAVVTRQWYRNGVAIVGATGKSYKILKADKGATIKYKFTLTASAYFDYTKTSSSHKIVK